MSFHRISCLWLILLLLPGCLERQPEEFAPARLGAVRAEAGYYDVRFTVEASGAWTECGVYFGQEAEALNKIAGERTEAGFTVEITGLEDATDYVWRAYLGNGREEILSAQERLMTQKYPFVRIPDPAFKAWLVAHCDTDADGEISPKEAHAVFHIDCWEGVGAKSLEGIEAFTALRSLAWENDLLEAVDLSQNTRLEGLFLKNNHLREIDLSNNPLLVDIGLENNNLTSLDLSGLKDLRKAVVGCQPLSQLHLPADSRLEELFCQSARLEQLDLSRCARLWRLECYGNHLAELDLSANSQLRILYCWQNDLIGLDVSGLAKLEDLRCAQNDFSWGGLDLSRCPELKYLWCNDDRLDMLDVSANPQLVELGCYDNPLGTLLDLTGNLKLDTLAIRNCPNLAKVYLATGQTVARGIVKDAATQVLYVSGSPPADIPDPGFRAFLLKWYDTDKNGEISLAETRRITQFAACSDEWNIQSLKGIEYMQNLTELHCWGTWIDDLNLNQPYYHIGRYHWDELIGPVGTLLEVDVSHNPNLVVLNLDHNAGLCTRSRTIDLSHNPKLQTLSIKFTDWEYPDVSALTDLRVLNLSHLHGTPPDISRLSKLRELSINWPQDYRRDFVVHAANYPDLERLEIDGTGGIDDLSPLTKLRVLGLGYLNLKEIDVSRFPPLEELYLASNLLTSIDLSSQPTLRRLGLDGCQLQVLDVSCLPKLEWLDAAPQTSLKTIYVSAGQDIPGITRDRSERVIPSQAQVVVK